jgi:hypothetical protein
MEYSEVLSWHGKGSEFLEGTVEEMEMVMCDWYVANISIIFDAP